MEEVNSFRREERKVPKDVDDQLSLKEANSNSSEESMYERVLKPNSRAYVKTHSPGGMMNEAAIYG